MKEVNEAHCLPIEGIQLLAEEKSWKLSLLKRGSSTWDVP